MDELAELIAMRAYYLWEKGGRPEGGSERYWFEAEQQLKEEHYGGNKPRTASGGDNPADVLEPAVVSDIDQERLE